MKLSILSMGVLIAAAGVACSSEDSAKIGDPAAVDKSVLAAYAASWEGYVEAFTFISGSDHLRLSLDKEGKGWLQVGDSADALPPPTDPNVAWPPQYAAVDSDPLILADRLVDGFRYPITGAKVEAERIRFSIHPYDAFAAWCALQTPVFDKSISIYNCASSVYFPSPDGKCAAGDASDPRPINCGKMELCMQEVCSCDANACKAGTSSQSVSVDATLTDEAGSKLEGSILLPGEANGMSRSKGPYTIRLRR